MMGKSELERIINNMTIDHVLSFEMVLKSLAKHVSYSDDDKTYIEQIKHNDKNKNHTVDRNVESED